jgi:SPP1 gp7 family putative phage head morphogenesis protein
MFLTAPAPFPEAAAAVRKLGVVDPDTFAQLLPEIQGMCICVSGLDSLDAVKAIRDEIAKLPEGADFTKQRDRIADIMSPWMNPKAAEKRATLLLRMHGFRTYAAAAYRQMEEQSDVFPWRQYLATMDSHTRPAHAALHGKVLPSSHSFWLNHTGPWEFNCRCEAVPLTDFDMEEMKAADLADTSLPPEDRRVLEGVFLDELTNNGRVVKPNGTGYFDVRTPREKSGDPNAFEWRAGDMGLPFDAIKKRYAPDVWKAWEKRAAGLKLSDGRTVLEWMGGKLPPKRVRKPKPAPVATPGPSPSIPSSRTAATVQASLAPILSELAAVRANPGLDKDARIADLNLRARALVELPPAERGTLKVTAATKQVYKWVTDSSGNRTLQLAPQALAGKAIVRAAQKGADEVVKVVHPDYLPKIEVNLDRSGRASCLVLADRGRINVSGTTQLKTMAHEIAHAVEGLHPPVINAAVAFRASRTIGEKPQSLRTLTGLNYDAWEETLEDEWKKRGGDHYAGKVYPGDKYTEIITMGIERFLYQTAQFAADDPDYFKLMLTALQKL